MNQCQNQKNTIDPQTFDNYGADEVRLFILSDSPPEKDIQWSERGMEASYKFIQKLWLLHKKITTYNSNEGDDKNDEEINIFINNMIDKITKNLENFHYNVIIANLHETYNFLIEMIKQNLDSKNLLQNYIKILLILNPIIPHFSSECLEQIEYKKNLSWPLVNKKFLLKKEFIIVIQINGKKKDLIITDKEIDEKKLLEQINSNEKTSKLLGNAKIKKVIYIKNKLINLII